MLNYSHDCNARRSEYERIPRGHIVFGGVAWNKTAGASRKEFETEEVL